MIVPLLVLVAIFVLIAVRKIGKFKFELWQIMLLGAIVVLITNQISPLNALKSIHLEVMLFLFAMFIIGQALEESGYLSHLSYQIFKRAGSAKQLLFGIIFGMGIASAVLMNDTIAIIGTPIVLLLARKHCLPAKPLLLALAFSITIGSMISPIGNPQNLLIALNGNIENPFVHFIKIFFIPTLINLFLAYLMISFFYRDSFRCSLNHIQEKIKDHKLALLSKISLLLLLFLIALKIALALFHLPFDFSIASIALLSALPIVIGSSKRTEIIKKIDWHTLIFFVTMFIVMQSVWDTGFFQMIIDHSKLEITSPEAIITISILLSQVISNLPLVALYLPLLLHAGAGTLEVSALAVGSTIAGNLFILGAASNIIIIQNAEKKGSETITFFEFAKIGIPLTILNALVYWLFLSVF